MSPTTRPAPLPNLYSVKEVADHFKVCTKTVHRWIHDGELPIHKIGRGIRISETDLNTFIKTKRQ